MIIDANGHILGRLATEVVQQLKQGTEVYIINAEHCVVSGRKEQVIQSFQQKKQRGQRDHGPFYPRLPDRMIKRTVRSMLPKNKYGEACLDQLRVFVGVPNGIATEDAVQFASAHKNRLQRDRYVTLGDVSQHLGAPQEVST